MRAKRFHLDALLAGLLFVVIGTLFLLDAYDVLEMDGFYVIPIVLVTIGLGIILEGLPPFRDNVQNE
jgi:hypothetical protein